MLQLCAAEMALIAHAMRKNLCSMRMEVLGCNPLFSALPALQPKRVIIRKPVVYERHRPPLLQGPDFQIKQQGASRRVVVSTPSSTFPTSGVAINLSNSSGTRNHLIYICI